MKKKENNTSLSCCYSLAHDHNNEQRIGQKEKPKQNNKYIDNQMYACVYEKVFYMDVKRKQQQKRNHLLL